MESMSRLGSLLENARDLTLEAAKDAGPRRPARPLPAQQIKKLLDSSNERDVLEGLRRVISMQYANPPQPTLTFFPAVLKTLSKQSASTRPLVYNYLLHHAEADPDTALLAINTIQKTLSDSNPRTRALALKTIAGIRVPVISQIISLAIKKGVTDLSPLVRKTAALACIKCVRLDPSTRPQVEEYLKTLLTDQQYYVVGAAVQAFLQVCPDRIDMIHPVYRKLCKMVLDMDEWGQLATLNLMLSYARQSFPRKTKRIAKSSQKSVSAASFYSDGATEHEEGETDEIEDLDPDLVTLLRAAGQLLQSRSSSVTIAVTKLFRYLSPNEHLPSAVGPLISLLRSPQDIRELALHNIVQVCLCLPSAFVQYTRHFFIRSTDSTHTRSLKLEVLTLSFPHMPKELQSLVLAELEHFSACTDEYLVRASVRAIGRCAQTADSVTSRRCLALLLKQIHAEDKYLVGEAVEVVRHLIQRDPDRHHNTVIQLAKHLDTLSSPTARADVIWLVGEFAGRDAEQNIAADVLRILIKNYANETNEVKKQIVLLAAKVHLHELLATRTKHSDTDETDQTQLDADKTESTVSKLYQYVLLLARYSQNYDLRDRARTYKALLADPGSTELASLMLLAPKPIPQAPSPSENSKAYTIGSASLVVSGSASYRLAGYEPVPDWVEDGLEPEPSLRDAGEMRVDSTAKPVSSASQRLDEALSADGRYRSERSEKKDKSLDAWLDEDEEEEEEEESDESSEYESQTESDETDENDDEDAHQAA